MFVDPFDEPEEDAPAKTRKYPNRTQSGKGSVKLTDKFASFGFFNSDTIKSYRPDDKQFSFLFGLNDQLPLEPVTDEDRELLDKLKKYQAYLVASVSELANPSIQMKKKLLCLQQG